MIINQHAPMHVRMIRLGSGYHDIAYETITCQNAPHEKIIKCSTKSGSMQLMFKVQC